ncbi:MAG: hypothetical protein SFU99_03525 [Saprospiraceae bacterium]|nr:hypothetical protein [Saprospiraceae bacterium]
MADTIPVQFVTDEAGNRQAVLISLQEWQKIQQELKEWREYRALKKSLKTAFKEVEQIKKGKQPRITLKEFLRES